MGNVVHVGTWVACCTPERDFIKWGQDGDTVMPFPPDDVEALKQAEYLATSETHKGDRFYILHVFNNGQMKTWEYQPKKKLIVKKTVIVHLAGHEYAVEHDHEKILRIACKGRWTLAEPKYIGDDWLIEQLEKKLGLGEFRTK